MMNKNFQNKKNPIRCWDIYKIRQGIRPTLICRTLYVREYYMWKRAANGLVSKRLTG